MLLGPPRVERDGATVAFDTRKAVALLAVLALADRPRPRDVLADLLWPEHDAEHARGALRRTLSALRSAVGADVVYATRDSVSLGRSAGLRIGKCGVDLAGRIDLGWWARCWRIGVGCERPDPLAGLLCC